MPPRTLLARRKLLTATAALAACRSGASSSSERTTNQPEPAPSSGASPFVHGIASGDPTTTSVILWTRVSPKTSADEIEVKWQIAGDREFRTSVAEGSVMATAERDHTVKVDANGLRPGRTYFYRFEAQGHRSQIGRTRTAPKYTRKVRFAVTSCSNYPFGLFNVYAAIAKSQQLDAVLHLGDYLYEYENGRYGDGTALDRLPQPADREMVSLADYRARHAVYKTDPDLQAMHRQHPMIAVWDDHELTNDAWRNGAENHQDDEGDWATRRSAAIKAYREWMPIRERAAQDLELVVHRRFRYGDLVDLIMLDTRLVGRDQQADWHTPGWESIVADPNRSLLGAAQERWLATQLEQSRDDGIAWRVLGQQVLMSQLQPESLGPWVNTDMWDGYAPARAKLLDHIRRAEIRDLIVLTGDIHSSWATEVSPDPFREQAPLAVELVTPAVSSPPPVPPDEALEREASVPRTHPHVRWLELRHRGFIQLDIDHERAVSRWMFVDDVATPDATATNGQAMAIARGAARLQPVPVLKSPFE